MLSRNRIAGRILACGLAGPGIAAAAAPNDGALDTTWGFFNSGKAIVAFDGGGDDADVATGSVVAPDGSMYIAGTVKDASGINRMGITKLLPNGGIDTNFGTNGRVLSQASQGVMRASAGIVLRNNSLLVGGYRELAGNNRDFALCAFSTSGVPALFTSTFTSCVTASFDLGPTLSRDLAQGIAIQPDGKIVLAGTTAVADINDTYAAFVRFNPSGALDTGFGLSNSGQTLFRTSNIFTRHRINAVEIGSNGKIVAVGSTDVVGSTDTGALIVRLSATGQVEPMTNTDECTFSVDGSGSRDTELKNLTLVPAVGGGNDDAVVVGYTQLSGTTHSGLVAKITDQCVRNNAFSGDDGTNGYATVTAGDGIDFEGVAYQPGTGYVVAGTYFPTGAASDLLVGRYRLNGAVDSLVNQIDFSLPGQFDGLADVHVQGNGIYMAGYGLQSGSNFDFVAAKLVVDRIFANRFEN